MTDDTAWPLAQCVCRTRYADLPASYRRDIVETLGCMLGGSGSQGSPSSLPFLRMRIFRAAARVRFLTGADNLGAADVTEVSAGELSTLRLAALYYPRPASSMTRNSG
jgi:hypothetical protein